MKKIDDILSKIENNIEKTMEENGLSKVPEGQQFWEGTMDCISQIKKQLNQPQKLNKTGSRDLIDKIIDNLIEEKNANINKAEYCEGVVSGINYAISTTQGLERGASFDEIARVMIKHLANPEKYHPHHRVVIDSTNAELLEGKQSTGQVLDYITN